MKNKFKKSKIIVPALALITATTVASVTGTVAWFTASRAVTVSSNAFASTKLESNLEVTLTGGNGTSVNSSDSKQIDIDGKLTHGSYDAKNYSISDSKDTNTGHLYTAVLSDSDTNPSTYTDLDTIIGGKPTTTNNVTTSKWLARTDVGGKIWYGVSWTMTFVLSSQTSNQTDYLLFDAKNSSFNDANQTQAGTKTALGFRIALMTANKYFVVGGDDTKTHVASTSATNSFGDDNYVQIGTGNEKLSDNDSDLATNNLNFGAISNTNSVSITCVAWYEGTDPNVVSRYESDSSTHTYADTIMSSITSSLVFYTRYVTTTA